MSSSRLYLLARTVNPRRAKFEGRHPRNRLPGEKFEAKWAEVQATAFKAR